MIINHNINNHSFISLFFRYLQSDWGWNDSEKKSEMSSPAAWYLIVHSNEDKIPVACSHFRFDMDCGDPVVYWLVNIINHY